MLRKLEKESIDIIQKIYAREKRVALLWSMGKDSTVLLWLCKKAFEGNIPFSVIHVDTTFKFPEMYEFRDHYAKEFEINLEIYKNKQALAKGINYSNNKATDVCHQLKTKPLQKAVRDKKLCGLFVGIRSDEHNARGKESVISMRESDFTFDARKGQNIQIKDVSEEIFKEGQHMRIHPILKWTESDIWEYIKQENIPVCDLYFAKNGQRYRSLGCQPITKPIKSEAQTIQDIITEIQGSAITERSGRLQDKESAEAMQKLRSLGYM